MQIEKDSLENWNLQLVDDLLPLCDFIITFIIISNVQRNRIYLVRKAQYQMLLRIFL